MTEDVELGPSSVNRSFNRNPSGKNQHKGCPPKGDDRVSKALWDYHKRNIENYGRISELLLAEHGITMSPKTVQRRRAELGITGSGKTTKQLPDTEKRQLLLNTLAKHPNRMTGPRTIKEELAYDSSVHLTRQWIEDEMRKIDPDGFRLRHPTAKKPHRAPLVALGPHHEWSFDGHDKLNQIGFPIWGIRDIWSGKWMSMSVMPNNRLKDATAYLYLRLVRDLGGMPMTSVSGCGTATTAIHGLANALRETFAPDLSRADVQPHVVLPNSRNTIIEQGWLRLRLDWGDNVIASYNAGKDRYNPLEEQQSNLVHWLWPKVIQLELARLMDRMNNHKIRKDRRKLLPSGTSPNIAYALHSKYGAVDCLQPVSRVVVERMMEEVGGESLIAFVSPPFARRAQDVFEALGVEELTLQNTWDVFSAMLPLL